MNKNGNPELLLTGRHFFIAGTAIVLAGIAGLLAGFRSTEHLVCRGVWYQENAFNQKSLGKSDVMNVAINYAWFHNVPGRTNVGDVEIHHHGKNPAGGETTVSSLEAGPGGILSAGLGQRIYTAFYFDPGTDEVNVYLPDKLNFHGHCEP